MDNMPVNFKTKAMNGLQEDHHRKGTSEPYEPADFEEEGEFYGSSYTNAPNFIEPNHKNCTRYALIILVAATAILSTLIIFFVE